MIYVDRSAVPIPEHLTSRRVNAEREKITRLLAGSKEHLEQTRIQLDSRIWMAAKPALIDLFHGKCAYCETRIVSFASPDVEHFRPKIGAEEVDGKRSHYYYSWLAYDWENLLIACELCNRRHAVNKRIVGKGSNFPVLGNRARLLATVEECRATEKSLLLDPCFDRPDEHLSFVSTGVCAARSERGEATIQMLHLNRPGLVEARRATWMNVERDVGVVLTSLLIEQRVQVQEEFFEKILSGQREYAATVRAALRSQASRLAEAMVSLPAEVMRSPDRTQEAAPLAARHGARADVVEAVTAISEPRRRYKGYAELPPHARETIRRIEVRNFKAIEEVELEISKPPSGQELRTPTLMLLGENATGKSSVLEAVALALIGTEEIARLELKASTFVRRAGEPGSRANPSESAEIAVHFDGGGPPVRLTISAHSGRFEGETRPATVLLGYGPRRFFSDRRWVHRSYNQSERVLTLFDPLAVISNPTSWLINCKQPSFNAAIRALRELLLMPEEALVTRPPRGRRRGAEIMLQVQGNSEPLGQLSEGYKTTIASGVDVMREMLRYWPDLEVARGVVLIDEIETHLHPRWKMRIVDRLRRAMPGVQFIATTHDPLCLRGLEDGEAQVLRRDSDGKIERLIDLPNLRGLSVEQLLTSEFFGLYSTEDPGFEEEMARYVALAAKQDRSPDEDLELEQYRGHVRETVTLGSTPENRLVQTALNEYLVRQRRVAARERPALKKATVDKVVDLWRSLSEDDGS